MRNIEQLRELRKLASQTSSASVADAMHEDPHRLHMAGVVCQTPDRPLFGEAVTLRSLPFRADLADELREEAGGKRSQFPFERALEFCTEGRVLVIDSSGWHATAVGGDTKFSRLMGLGGAGIVTDGAIRDQKEMDGFGYPIFCSGFTPIAGTGRALIGAQLNVPISCGRVLVRPGDFLIGDTTGVVVIPGERAREVLERSIRIEKLNAFVQELIVTEDVNPGEVYPATAEVKARFTKETGIEMERGPN